MEIILILIGFIALLSLIARFVQWIHGKINKVTSDSSTTIQTTQAPVMEATEEFKVSQIEHMIRIVEISIRNRTGKIISVPWPSTEEEKIKLKKMYDGVLENIGM